MRGNIVVKILIAIVVFVAGWTLGQVLEDYSPFVLDWTVSLSDVLTILVDIALAIVLAILIEKGMQNQRVEKDFFITELDEIQKSFTELGKFCSRLVPLSLNQTVYQVEKPRKDLLKLWETMEIRNKSFHGKKKDEFNELIKTIKKLNSQLSDSSYFSAADGYKPVSIKRGTIHLNGSVTEEIDKSFGEIKDAIFKMKIAINEM